MNANCGACGSPLTCDRCGERAASHRLPPPFGSLNAKMPAAVCAPCYRAWARLGFEWLGRDVPEMDLP